ncbi:MAG: hypothetical protein FWB79_05755 [Treponema sp.]|nr:hypothetical protein [Treponema sp.]
MRTRFFAALCASFLAVSCGAILHETAPGYVPNLPDPPPAWTALLGDPHWRIEWFDGEGRKRYAELPGPGSPGISPPQTLATPVLALPFWPEKGIAPGVFRPAGAVFPFDVSGNRIFLSWQGGVEAAFFLELARAANGGLPPDGTAALRLPWNFNWPRFRRLFADPALNAEIRADPWLADWPGIADRTVRSGFDRRRLVPEARTALELPLDPGPWIGASPFAAPLAFESNPVFQVGPSADTWVSAGGLLRANTGAWIWREFSPPP